MSLHLRPAMNEDVGLILGFIRELAAYEKLTDECVATQEGLQQHLFGHHPKAEVIIAEWEEEAVGFALFFHTFSTFLAKPGIYLEDLYVRPEFRSKGIGKSLLIYLARLAKIRGCGRVEWSVLNWNTPSIEFYKSLGAQPLEDWTGYRLSGDALDKLANPIA
ncbi:GNAT family N-acetyltransferase [Bryobacter aggregatus]|uniref:GNAT family N-acetyltransferase n=1 Tax=Bryobacter aggregatus TaxID=360054 RepID=UPI0004E0E3A4|nr:GNAT family N-acetyltransferase [Bryobacter aggregatus]